VAGLNPAPRGTAWALLVGLCGCSPYGASLLTRAPYYPQPVYQPQPTPPPPAPYYATRPAAPYYSPPPSLFEPPPGPITDSCFPELQNRLEARQRVLALGAAGQQYLPLDDLKVRRTWEACQRQYLAALEKRANANPPGETPTTTPPAPEPPPTTAVAAEPAVDAPPAPPDQVPAAANADAPTVATNPTPTETAPPPKAAEPKPRKLSAADRQAIADRKAKQEAERAQKKAAKEALKQEAKQAVEQIRNEYCGEAPTKSAWSGIYHGLEDFFKESANDPDSIKFSACSDAVEKNPPACWIVVCDVRGKNRLGALVLDRYAFGKSTRGWRQLKGPE
jgi:hypothetical protein